ncbi:glycerol-3-phosphate 1-O-acyltransferase PlsY [uncultured Dialister sp.]|jgi:glycerol-3-phosphate acyltransferase PlsY|uniref:glycerol-3-phosphate 1-O-acyltransferase PlsY n=1 Tax=uncultured Dialister sp. TaxID=278064 RepID=UPI0025FAFDE9|nr:glycerol-3-phosphate 1-O-acyltransferase PlsY [uncultured Dialister sp.]
MSIVWIILAYFIGAIPSGYIIGRVFYGVNLKKVGSGNIGATNAYRELGAKAGAAVFICDFLKGFIAVHLGMPDPTIVLACAVFAIIGNDWSVFLHFKSGKGVACGVGAFTYICFPAVLAAFLVWLVLFKWKHIVSLGSILAAPVVPIVMLVVGEPLEYVAFGALAAVIVIGKHKDNIRRLLRGEEKPISREKR